MDDNIVHLKDFKDKKTKIDLEKALEDYFMGLDSIDFMPKPKSQLMVKLEVLAELQERLQEELDDLVILQEELLQSQSILSKRTTWKMIKKVTTTLKVIRSNIEVKKKEIIRGGGR